MTHYRRRNGLTPRHLHRLSPVPLLRNAALWLLESLDAQRMPDLPYTPWTSRAKGNISTEPGVWIDAEDVRTLVEIFQDINRCLQHGGLETVTSLEQLQWVTTEKTLAREAQNVEEKR